MKYKFYLFLILITISMGLAFGKNHSEKKSSIKVVKKEMVTYPYSAPRSVPDFGRLYPYFRFDRYTADGVVQEWEMVELENDYIKLWVMPAVGGKVWGAVEKKTGKEFIYFNHVVKFRDVAMRGAWTSGGIEMNFGLIGHSPWCSDAVDYQLKEYPDGSVGCIVGGLDLALETDWRVEIILPPNKAYFETRVLWFNGSGWDRPAYQWMNAGIKAEGNLEYIFAGDHYLDHDGKTYPWPADKNGNMLNWYEQNDHGHYKSYHVAGKYTDFWGAYWHHDGFGIGHTADYSDKPGKKIWIWGLSDYGMLWEELLTDNDGQYTEVQSGRLFNQSNASSFKTPFKHGKLFPYTTQCWSEYWYPVEGTDGIIYGNTDVVFNIVSRGDKKCLKLYAISELNEEIRLVVNENNIVKQKLHLQPTEQDSIFFDDINLSSYIVYIGNKEIYRESLEKSDRPKELPKNYNQESLYATYLRGLEYERQFFFTEAEREFLKSLSKDPYFIPSLTRMGGICYERNDLEDADKYLRTALSINAYDAASNYLWGIVQLKQGKRENALDALSIASLSDEYRSASYTELAKLALQEKDYHHAELMASRALKANPYNLAALQLKIVTACLLGNVEKANRAVKNLQKLDGLNHFAAYENYLLTKDTSDLKEFTQGIRNAFGYESYISIADFYTQIGLYDDALTVLSVAPDNTKITYWRAYLYHLIGKEEKAFSELKRAIDADQSLIFPFRKNEYLLFQWACNNFNYWQANYHLALLYKRANNNGKSLALLDKYQNKPDFYPYYVLRASLQTDKLKTEADLKKARELSPTLAYTSLLLSQHYLNSQEWGKAIEVLEAQYRKDKTDYSVAIKLAEAYGLKGELKKSIDLMKIINILPYEGAQEGRDLWRETNLKLAFQAINLKKEKQALTYIEQALIWPKNIGVGKPYDHTIDERVEMFMKLYILSKTKGNKTDINRALSYVLNFADNPDYVPYRSADILTALLLQKNGETNKANEWIAQWLNKSPKSQIARWCEAVYNRKWEEAERIPNEKVEAQETLPYVTIFIDRDFLLLKENINLLKEFFEFSQ